MTAAAPPPTVPGLTGLTVLARGGYATVYRAVQESLGREVAVKIENRTLENDRDQRRFLREARAAGRMSSHPHVVDLFDAGMTSNGHPYLIMELCDGSYAERMRTVPLSAAEAREVGVKIADALADAHSLGVLHRDVKPANILFSRFGEPALADFGLAILVEWRDISVTLDVLTPAYAPPEMFRHAPPSPAADVYALAATLYALVRGRPPRWPEGHAPPSLVSLVDMFAEEIPDLPGVPADMMALLRAGMANDESARPSASQLRDALQALRLEPPPVVIPPLGLFPPVEFSPVEFSPAEPAPSDEVTVPHETPQGEPGVPEPAAPPAPSAPSQGPSAPSQGPSAPSQGPSAPPVRGPAVPPVAPSGPRRRRGLWWWSLAAGVIVLAGMVAFGFAYGPDLRDVGTFRSPPVDGSTGTSTASPSISASPIPPSPDGSSGPAWQACGRPAPRQAKCIRAPECYDTAKKLVDCGGKHTWEAFAFADLPANVRPADAPQHPEVRQVCSVFTLLLVDPGAVAELWKIEVLVPSGGNRTYRCLAGQGPDALTGRQLGPP